MITVDAAIVDPALPTIVRQPHIDAVTAEWVTSMYSLARGGLSPVPSALARFVVGALLLELAAGSLAAGGATPVLARRIGARGVARLGMTLELLGIAGPGLSLSASGRGWRLVPALGYLQGGAALVHAAGLAVTAAARDAAWFAASFVAVGLLATFALPRAQAAATLDERGAAGPPAVRAPEREPTSGSEPERDPALEPDVVGGSVSV